MDFDDILKLADDFGSYQRLLLGFILLPAFIPCGFHAYNQLFMAATPAHWCVESIPSNWNLTTQKVKDLTIPIEVTTEEKLAYQKCQKYELDFLLEEIPFEISLQQVHETIELNLMGNSTWPIVACSNGWNYDYSTYSSTVITEWNIVCERSFLPTLALILFGFSGLVGNFIFGYIQDTLGRRPAFFIYLTIQCIFGVATAFAFDFWSWLLCRIGVGFTIPAITGTPFVLAMEMVGPSKRTLCTILLNISYSLCLMALAGVAYLVRDWRQLALATSLPFIIGFAYWWVLPESPRWLYAHGKLRETEILLKTMAKVNGRTLPRDFQKILKDSYLMGKLNIDDVVGDKFGIRQLFQGKVLRKNTLIITFIWLINMGVYVGLSYYAPILGGSMFWNFFVAGLAELPTYIFLFPSLDYWGRRWTLFGSMLLGGSACVATVFTHTDTWMTLSLYGIGKFGVSAGFVAIQQMAAETYPTVVRGLGISFSNVVGMVGPTLVPLLNYTGSTNLYLPFLTLGCLMITGGILGLALPETVGKSLPQSLADAEKLTFTASCCPDTKVHKGIASENKLAKHEVDIRVT